MPELTRAALTGVFFLAWATGVGGYVAIAVVAPVATRTLATGQRVSFFRSRGRSYLGVGSRRWS